MAKTISLIIHRFKEVRINMLAMILEDSPTFKNNGGQVYLNDRELLQLLESLGKSHEEASAILDKVTPTPSHYRLQLSLSDQQEDEAHRMFTEPW
jgi:hypothetical protein